MKIKFTFVEEIKEWFNRKYPKKSEKRKKIVNRLDSSIDILGDLLEFALKPRLIIFFITFFIIYSVMGLMFDGINNTIKLSNASTEITQSLSFISTPIIKLLFSIIMAFIALIPFRMLTNDEM